MQANKLFFLTAVSSHIQADVKSFNDTTLIRFWDSSDVKQFSLLIVEVTKLGKSFVISYTMENGNSSIQQGNSDPVQPENVFGVLAALANDAFKA